jgi:serine/threonine-protein kinase HipA
MRLPQEDLCQVTGTPSSGKYESDGGPGVEAVMRLLLGSRVSAKDREAFFTAQILFWLLAAPDGHAKNFSVFIERGGRFRLTPLYDIMSAYPVMGHGSGRIPPEKLKLAMAFVGRNRHYEWSKIGPRHIRETARRCGLESAVEEVISRFTEGVPRAVREVSSRLPEGFPASVARSILDGFQERARLLELP